MKTYRHLIYSSCVPRKRLYDSVGNRAGKKKISSLGLRWILKETLECILHLIICPNSKRGSWAFITLCLQSWAESPKGNIISKPLLANSSVLQRHTSVAKCHRGVAIGAKHAWARERKSVDSKGDWGSPCRVAWVSLLCVHRIREPSYYLRRY